MFPLSVFHVCLVYAVCHFNVQLKPDQSESLIEGLLYHVRICVCVCVCLHYLKVNLVY